MKRHIAWFPLAALAGLLAACGATPTPVILPTDTPPPSPTATATSTPTALPTPTSTPEMEWYLPLDPAYSVLKYRYGLVSSPSARIYLTLEDAAAASGNFGTPGDAPVYIYISGEASSGGKTWYTTRLGWISAEEVQLVTPSSLRGILLTRQVDFRFSWVLREVQSMNAAGAPIRIYTRYDLVHEIQAVTANPGFFAIGADEWLPLDALAVTDAVLPAELPAGMCRFIYVDLTTQVLRAFDDCHIVFATLVSTGADPRWTAPGSYSILNKLEYTKLTQPIGSVSVYSLEGVPDFMTYAGDWGLHAAYWHDDFGSPVSHGCVNLSPADARWLFEWAYEGERVLIVRSQE